MALTTLRFAGCEVWPLDNEIIEVVVGPQRFDLHNDADLKQVAIRSQASGTVLKLSFYARPLGVGVESGLALLAVEFQHVTDLDLSANVDAPCEAGFFSSFEYRGGQEVGFETDWLQARFHAESVAVSVEPLATAKDLKQGR